jgi:hypothetical protein
MFLTRNKLVQAGSGTSTNLQAGRDIHVHGISYSDARELFLDLYKQQAGNLALEAATLAADRAEDLVHNLLLRLEKDSPNNAASLREPGFHSAVVAAQQNYASSGDEDLGEVLVNLLVERADHPAQTFLNSVLRQAVDVAPVINSDQWNALSAIFVLRDVLPETQAINETQELSAFLKTSFLPLLGETLNTDRDFRNVFYSGCAVRTSSESLSTLLARKLPWILSKPVSMIKLVSLDRRAVQLLDTENHDRGGVHLSRAACVDLTREAAALGIPPDVTLELRRMLDSSLAHSEKECRDCFLRLIDDFERMDDLWSKRPISGASLTPVGFAIAQSNIRRRLDQTYELSHWLQ